jgi:predicted DNA-binding transcriptional regulator AlpA
MWGKFLEPAPLFNARRAHIIRNCPANRWPIQDGQMSADIITTRVYSRVSEIANNRRTGARGILPVSAATWWLWVKEKKAPQPIRLSAGVTVWRTADVLAFAESLAEQAA